MEAVERDALWLLYWRTELEKARFAQIAEEKRRLYGTR
jgi:hypothetical protein